MWPLECILMHDNVRCRIEDQFVHFLFLYEYRESRAYKNLLVSTDVHPKNSADLRHTIRSSDLHKQEVWKLQTRTLMFYPSPTVRPAQPTSAFRCSRVKLK